MFSGIVETTARILRTSARAEVLEIHVEKPPSFDDLQLGDSIAVDGVCLTAEQFGPGHIQFALGPETLKITGWTADSVLNKVVNLERSLRLNDRVHGHLVTGHVDALGQVAEIQKREESLDLMIHLPETLRPYVWPKGSVTVNGVSLTVNQAEGQHFQVGLIPETLKRTNLGQLKIGSPVNLEVDNIARGLLHMKRLEDENA